MVFYSETSAVSAVTRRLKTLEGLRLVLELVELWMEHSERCPRCLMGLAWIHVT